MSNFIKSKKFIGVFYKVLQNGDRSYYISYKIAGKFHRIHIGKKSEGVNEAFCHQKRNDALNAEKFGDETPIVKHKKKKTTTIDALAHIYFSETKYENRSAKRQEGKYNLHIQPLFGDEDPSDLVRSDIVSFRNELLDAGKAPKTIDGIIQLLSTIINYSIKEKELKVVNPCIGVKRLKKDNARERYLTLAEIQLLKERVKEDADLYTFTLLALVTGGRVQTILGIQAKDIDMTNHSVTLKDVKNSSSYKGFLDQETLAHLASFLTQLGINDYVVGRERTPFPMRTLQRKLLRVINKLFNEGLERSDTRNRAVIHTLRHTFASQLAIAGTPIYTIQKLMNHADIQQTMRYAKLAPDSGKDHVQKLYE